MPAAEFTAGQEVWAHTGTEASFERGKVERLDPHKKIIAVRLKAGVVDVKEADVHKVNAAAQDGVPDNTYLRELNEATLLHNVRTRYNDPKDDGGCYSVTGHILIAVNPFRKLNIYEESNVRTRLCARTPADGSPCAPALAALALPARRCRGGRRAITAGVAVATEAAQGRRSPIGGAEWGGECGRTLACPRPRGPTPPAALSHRAWPPLNFSLRPLHAP